MPKRAGLLMPGSDATVLVIWETILKTMTRNESLGIGLGTVGAWGDDDADVGFGKAAVATAADGAHRAAGVGLVARPRTAHRDNDIAAVILGVAADEDADVIVLGTRGLRRREVADAGQRLVRCASSRRPGRLGGSLPGPTA